VKIVVAGAGIGGLTAALFLRRAGHEVEIIERSSEFGEVGAGVQVSPNAARVLADLGLGDRLDQVGVAPDEIVFRRWEDDRVLLTNPMGRAAKERYGFSSYNLYRPDLIGLLADAADGISVRFDSRVVGARSNESGPWVHLDDGSALGADLLVGADGVHSTVRISVFGPEITRFSGYVAYRALVPAEEVPDLESVVTIRMGPGRHLVTYFVGEGRQFLNIVGIVPETTWDVESWTEPGDLSELQAEFADFAPAVGDLLEKVVEPVFRWALHDREPLPKWITGNVVLLGDACHPMLPFMGQGACQAIEDAAVLTNCVTREPDLVWALARYESTRKPRTSDIQARSWANRKTYHLADGPDQEARDSLYAAASADSALLLLDSVYGHNALED
jgi:salicylate hydroxylase